MISKSIGKSQNSVVTSSDLCFRKNYVEEKMQVNWKGLNINLGKIFLAKKYMIVLRAVILEVKEDEFEQN